MASLVVVKKSFFPFRDEEIKIQETLLDAGLKKVNAEIGSSTPQSKCHCIFQSDSAT